MEKLFLRASLILGLFVALAAAFPMQGHAQSTGPYRGMPVVVWGIDSSTHLPCELGTQPYSATCALPGAGGGGGGSGAITAPLGTQTAAASVAVTDANDLGTSSPLYAAISSGTAAAGAAVPTSLNYVGANSSGNLTGIIQGDTTAPIAVTTATTTQIVAAATGKKTYVTHFDLVVSAADNATVEYGTGTNCATVAGYLTGSASASQQFAANGGVSEGSGLGPLWIVPAGDEICLVTSAAANAAGSITYTQF